MDRVSFHSSGVLISDGLLYCSPDTENETAPDASAQSSVSSIPDGETEKLISQHMMESDHTEVFDKYTNSIGEVCKNVVCIKYSDHSSYVTYYLGGKYDFFTATLSCPDDIDSGYSYDFQIWLDDNQMEPVYDLNMGRSTSPTPISIDLSGHESITFFVDRVSFHSSGVLISDGLLYLSQP